MKLQGLALFFTAFLLFQVQPWLAKILLPWFGGSAEVWITCLLFFHRAREKKKQYDSPRPALRRFLSTEVPEWGGSEFLDTKVPTVGQEGVFRWL